VVKVKDANAEYQASLKVGNECGFTKVELESILKLFKKYDPQKQGYVAFYDMLDMLHGTIYPSPT
jgi:Ca2+-binding EF-hand superfamily protein